MKFTPTSIINVILIEPQVFGDRRVFIMEAYFDGLLEMKEKMSFAYI